MAEKKKKGKGGPKTAAGKARVRRNPIKHGVLAQTPVLPLVEKEEDWETLRNGIFEYLKVEGALEAALADRIAVIFWRLYRVVRYESEAINAHMNDVPKEWSLLNTLSKQPKPTEVTQEMADEMDRMLMWRLLPGENTMNKVMRYESRLHRYLLQTLHQLLLLRGFRHYGSGRKSGETDMMPPGLPGRAGRQKVPMRGALERIEGGPSSLPGPSTGGR